MTYFFQLSWNTLFEFKHMVKNENGIFEKCLTLQPAQHLTVYPGCHLKHSERRQNLGLSEFITVICMMFRKHFFFFLPVLLLPKKCFARK